MSAPAEPEPQFLSPKQAANLAGLSTRAIYRAIERGDLQAVRLCSRLRISRAAFGEWVERGAVRVERPVVEIRTVPAARGSFRQLLDERPS
jgi:excisionase family DNA binding protein